VGCWVDQSGSGNNLTAPGDDNRPTFESDAGNALNGKPVLRFGNAGGIDRYLQGAYTASGQNLTLITLSVPAATTAEYASIFASASSLTAGAFQLDAGGSGSGCAGSYRLLYNMPPVGSACAGTLDATPRIVSARLFYNTAASTWTVSTWNNGATVANNAATSLVPAINLLRVGLNLDGDTVWPNDIAELMLYVPSLNTAERVLVENYLQAKYSDSLNNLAITNDRYDGDTTLNGDFDLDVAGIGRQDGGTSVHAHSAGMIIENYVPSFLSNNGDYVMFGHKDPANDITAQDLPDTTGWGGAYDARWVRHWYIDVSDAGGNGGLVTISFDFGEGGVLGAPDPPVSNYRLLRRIGSTGQFEDLASATAIDTVARTITFAGVDVALLGSNFTLGTLNQQDSPISDAPTAVTMLDMATASLPGGAQVTWSTALEVDTVLFNLYRAGALDGERSLVKQVLPQGQPGATYLVEDLGLTPFMTYYYWLEVVSVEGSETFELAPVTAWGSYFLPLMIRSQ
jgi:hypothetical protein